MNDIIFDHDRLDVYRFSIDYVSRSFVLARDLKLIARSENVAEPATQYQADVD